MNTRTKKRILFVSSKHPEPSVAAASLAKSIIGDGWEVSYACDSESMIMPYAAEYLKKSGLKIPTELPKHPAKLQNIPFDVVVTFCDQSLKLCPTFAGLPAHFHWPLDKLVSCSDPDLAECFTALTDILEERIRGLAHNDTLNVVTKLQATFGSLIDHLTDGVMAHDSDRRIFVFNRAAERITGYNLEEVIGRDCHEVFPNLICGGECSFCDGDIKKGERLRYPSQFVGKNGEIHDLEMSAINIQPTGRLSPATLIIFRDQTEVIRLKKTLEKEKGYHGIIGRHHAMQKVFQMIEDVANDDIPVLIQGESGTGKELVAEALHRQSDRRDHPMVPVNCGALPEGILESELFGHVKGSFTGAISDKKGRFELADGGTLFLDEIGEVSPAMQVKLLRVIEEKRFIPVGGEKSISTDIRIVCASNKNLAELVENGQFREDLFYRLAVYPIRIPPLRERTSDIELLLNHFLDHFSLSTGRYSAGIDREALELLKNYIWPGNVRQMANAVQYALIKCRGAIITKDHLPPEVKAEQRIEQSKRAGRPNKITRQMVARVLNRHGGNRAKAARELGIARSTLYRYLP